MALPVTDVVIRRAEERDLAALGRLGASLMRTHYAFDERRFMSPGDDPESGYAHFLSQQLNKPSSLVLVAERGQPTERREPVKRASTDAERRAVPPGEVMGYVYASVEPQSWKELRDEAGFVHDLMIAGEAREAGVGKQLLEAAIEWLREQGMPRVVLWTAAPNDVARRLFERRGFRPTMIEMTIELE
ncbi:MAG: GNAT family N-acetyltransferase [Acidobacteriota bacterium]|nr:GNAT family N-acetyltransferase [Acidobacteriota bacterium]